MNLKIILAGSAAVLASLLLVQCDRNEKLARDVTAARNEATTAITQAQFNQDVALAAIAKIKADRATDLSTQGYAHAAENAAEASGPVPDDVAALWAVGIDSVRDEAAATRTPVDPTR